MDGWIDNNYYHRFVTTNIFWLTEIDAIILHSDESMTIQGKSNRITFSICPVHLFDNDEFEKREKIAFKVKLGRKKMRWRKKNHNYDRISCC